MLTIVVDRAKCEGYGQCVLESEDLFELDDDGVSVPTSGVGDERRDDAERAADMCPMQAITVS